MLAAGVAIDLTVDGFTVQRGQGGTSTCAVDSGSIPIPPEQGAQGGGISAEATAGGTVSLTLTHVVLQRNGALSGGGLALCVRDPGSTLTATLADSLVTRNRATGTAPSFRGGGGGIRVRAKNDATLDVLIQRVALVRKRAVSEGGGLSADGIENPAGQVEIRDTTIIANKARQGDGGGLFVRCPAALCPITAVNSIFANNRARTGGGIEILSMGGPSPLLTNVTVRENQAPRRPDRIGGIAAWGAKVTNGILWGNHPHDLGSISQVSLDHTDAGDVQLIGGAVVDLGSNLSVDPLFVSPKDAHLQAGSPVIDAADCGSAPPADFEGDPRPTGGGCDMGADERFP